MESEVLSIFASGIGSNVHVAEYQSNIKFFDEIENFLLGSFDKNGKYEIPQQIAEELVKIKKVYMYAFGELAFCESEHSFDHIGKLQFAVKMEPVGKNMSAKLCIMQDIKRANGMFKKTAVTEISEFVALNSPSFVNDCFEKFNIHSKKEGGLQKTEFQQLDAQMTLNRLKYLSQKSLILDVQEEAFKDLVEKKLELLSKHKIGKSIIEQYKRFQKENAGKFKSGMGYYKHLNDLLDKLVEDQKAEFLTNAVLVTQWGKLNATISAKIKAEVIKDTLMSEQKHAQTQITETQTKNGTSHERNVVKPEKKETTLNPGKKPEIQPKPNKSPSSDLAGSANSKKVVQDSQNSVHVLSADMLESEISLKTESDNAEIERSNKFKNLEDIFRQTSHKEPANESLINENAESDLIFG